MNIKYSYLFIAYLKNTKVSNMKAVIMAGGFAKRLYPLTENFPKPLLKVGGRPVIDCILEKIEAIPEIEKIFIATNAKFEPVFIAWVKEKKFKKPTKLVIEQAEKEEQKLGAVGALNLLVKNEKINDDLLVVAGDNLFTFNLLGFAEKCRDAGHVAVGIYDIKDIEQAKRLGTVRMDGGRVVEFWEKSAEPKSTLASTGIYFYPKEKLCLLAEYLSAGNNPDAPGFFLQWLHKRETVLGFVFNKPEDKWFDIGTIEALKKAERSLKGKKMG